MKKNTRPSEPTTTLRQVSPLKQIISNVLDSKKAIDVVCVDLKDKSDVADDMIIASGTSSTHLGALADKVVKAFKENNIPVFSVTGKNDSDWVLIDTAYVIVHLFSPEARAEYNLEKMWSGCFSEAQMVEM